MINRTLVFCVLILNLCACASDFVFDETPVPGALREIAIKSGISILIGPDIQGKVTMNMPDIEPLELVRLICRLHNLTLERHGSVYTVSSEPPQAYTAMIRIDNADSESVASYIEQAFPNASAQALGPGRVWVRVPGGTELSEIEAFVAKIDVAPRDITVVLTLYKHIRTSSRKIREKSRLSLRLLEGCGGSIAIGRDEIIEVWPFVITDWKGYALNVRAGRISGNSVSLILEWVIAGQEKNMGCTEVSVRNGQEVLVGSLNAYKESSGWFIRLQPPEVSGGWHDNSRESVIQVYVRADFGDSEGPMNYKLLNDSF